MNSINSCLAIMDATASIQTNVGTFVPVPPVGRSPVSSIGTGGTVYPQRSRGSKFNQLAPHVPERLIAPRSAMTRQQQWSRAPPSLKPMASHG
jgi:hypothetical protein